MKFDFVWHAKSLTFPAKYGKLNKSLAREAEITEESAQNFLRNFQKGVDKAREM